MKTDFRSRVEAQRPYLLRYASLQLRDPQAALAWLYRIATNTALDKLRRKTPTTVPLDDVTLGEAEVASFRDYLLKGGFLWVVDFWGSYAWDVFAGQIRKLFPPSEFPIEDLPRDHPIFHSVFECYRRDAPLPLDGRNDARSWGILLCRFCRFSALCRYQYASGE